MFMRSDETVAQSLHMFPPNGLSEKTSLIYCLHNETHGLLHKVMLGLHNMTFYPNSYCSDMLKWQISILFGKEQRLQF